MSALSRYRVIQQENVYLVPVTTAELLTLRKKDSNLEQAMSELHDLIENAYPGSSKMVDMTSTTIGRNKFVAMRVTAN